jgi:hypothetical protein
VHFLITDIPLAPAEVFLFWMIMIGTDVPVVENHITEMRILLSLEAKRNFLQKTENQSNSLDTK